MKFSLALLLGTVFGASSDDKTRREMKQAFNQGLARLVLGLDPTEAADMLRELSLIRSFASELSDEEAEEADPVNEMISAYLERSTRDSRLLLIASDLKKHNKSFMTDLADFPASWVEKESTGFPSSNLPVETATYFFLHQDDEVLCPGLQMMSLRDCIGRLIGSVVLAKVAFERRPLMEMLFMITYSILDTPSMADGMHAMMAGVASRAIANSWRAMWDVNTPETASRLASFFEANKVLLEPFSSKYGGLNVFELLDPFLVPDDDTSRAKLIKAGQLIPVLEALGDEFKAHLEVDAAPRPPTRAESVARPPGLSRTTSVAADFPAVPRTTTSFYMNASPTASLPAWSLRTSSDAVYHTAALPPMQTQTWPSSDAGNASVPTPQSGERTYID